MNGELILAVIAIASLIVAIVSFAMYKKQQKTVVEEQPEEGNTIYIVVHVATGTRGVYFCGVSHTTSAKRTLESNIKRGILRIEKDAPELEQIDQANSLGEAGAILGYDYEEDRANFPSIYWEQPFWE